MRGICWSYERLAHFKNNLLKGVENLFNGVAKLWKVSSVCLIRGRSDLFKDFVHSFPGIVLRPLCLPSAVRKYVRNVMAHAHKPDLVLQRYG